MKQRIFSLVATLCAVALMSTTAMAQRTRSGSSGGMGRSSSSAPRSAPPRPQNPVNTTPPSGGMGRMNPSQPTNTTPNGIGMGRNNSTPTRPRVGGPTGSSSNFSSQTTAPGAGMGRNNSIGAGPRVGGSTSSTTHINLIGARPTTHYSRTIIVDGRTRYLYADGSYSWSATGFVVGYLSAQQAAQNQIMYNQAIMNAQTQQSQMNVDNAYANGVAQGQAQQAQQAYPNGAQYNNGYNGYNGYQNRGMGAGTVFLLVIVGVAVVIGFLYAISRR